MRRTRASDVALITSAPRSPGYEFDQRRRRYTVMMGLRIVCLIGAVCTYSLSLWLALAFIVGGAVLPWCAVLIANDGPPKKQRHRVRMDAPPTRQLPPTVPPRTIDY